MVIYFLCMMRSIWWDTHRRGKFYDYEPAVVYNSYPDVSDIIDARGTLDVGPDRIKIFNKHPLDLTEALCMKKYEPLLVVLCPPNIDTSELEKTDRITPVYKDIYRRTNLIESTGKQNFNRIDTLFTKATVFKNSSHVIQKTTIALPFLCMHVPEVKMSRGGRTYEDIMEKSIVESLVEMIFKTAILWRFDCIVIPVFPGPIAIVDILVDAIKRFPVKHIMFSTFGLDPEFIKSFTNIMRSKIKN